MNKSGQEIMAMNLRVLQREAPLRNVEKIVRMVRFAVMAKYDQEGKHWNYLKVRGPLFLVIDRFGKYRLVFMNHCQVGCRIINLDQDMKFELHKLEQGEGCLLNYMIQDSIMKRSVYGIWSQEEAIAELYSQLNKLSL